MPDASLRIFPVGVSPLVSELLSRLASPPVDRSVPVALRALQAFLARAPTVADLNAATMFDFSSTLIDRGISPETADRYLHAVRRLATAAVAEGLLEKSDVPRLPRWRGRWSKAKTRPWSIDELSQLFAALRTLRGTVSGIPASTWWTALLLTSLDLQQSAAPLVALSGPAFDPAAGTVVIGMYVYTVHARTAAAIAELGTGQAPRLFPWLLDESATPGGDPLYMVSYDFKKILKGAAGLPAGRLDMFRRLQVTGEEDPQVIDKIDWERRIELPHGTDESPAGLEVSTKSRRRRGNQYWDLAGEIHVGSHSKDAKPEEGPDVYLIANHSDRTIRHFFETVYVPRRLAYGSPDSRYTYGAAITRLNQYCATECTLDALTDDLVERMLAWWRPHRAADTLKRIRGEILSIWKYAYRKRYVETQPRDIDEIRTPKRLPEAWSIQELDRILTVAGSIEGKVCGIHASLYWPTLFLFLVETGLRIGAAMRLTVANFDSERGWIRVAWQTQKQKADQHLPISPQMVRMLLATCPAERELLFPFPFTNEEPRNERLREILKMAGLPHGRRDLWHRFRRTCATMTADVAGEAAAQQLLGHRCLSTTRAYIDVRKLRRARIVDHPDLQRPTWKPRALLTDDRPGPGPDAGQGNRQAEAG